MNTKEIIKSFKPQDELNPKIWYLPKEKNMGDSDGQEMKMRPEVREKLLETANIFIDFLGVDVIVTDIIMIGSLVNYNWSKFSDIDLHIVVNFNQFPENSRDLYLEFFDLKKVIFNQRHNIKMFGYDVECFVQKEDETTFSSGIYSILYDMWMNEPKKLNKETIDKELIKEKAKQWMRIIDGVVNNIEDEDPEEIKSIVKKYKEKLKNFRNCGLEKNGEMSIENLVFKLLRRNGYVEKLYELPTEIIDKKLSMKQ
jgi:predicted nucleotidyltransferase